MSGRGDAGQRGIKGGKWDNCNNTINSIINKIYFKKENPPVYMKITGVTKRSTLVILFLERPLNNWLIFKI